MLRWSIASFCRERSAAGRFRLAPFPRTPSLPALRASEKLPRLRGPRPLWRWSGAGFVALGPGV
eukprot:8269456-Alexandrium_andersonii.AAC.1